MTDGIHLAGGSWLVKCGKCHLHGGAIRERCWVIILSGIKKNNWQTFYSTLKKKALNIFTHTVIILSVFKADFQACDGTQILLHNIRTLSALLLCNPLDWTFNIFFMKPGSFPLCKFTSFQKCNPYHYVCEKCFDKDKIESVNCLQVVHKSFFRT